MTIFPPDHDHFHELGTPGAYEWSYFDGLDERGDLGFTAIWFRGLAMSPWYTAEIDRRLATAVPDQFSGLALHLFKGGKRIAGGVIEGPGYPFRHSSARPDVSYGETGVSFESRPDGTQSCRIDVDFPGRMNLSRLAGEISLTFPVHEALAPGPGDPSVHSWAPISPGGEFRAALDYSRKGRKTEHFRFAGRAYHDRNWGADPLHTLDVDWYWGRLHAGERTFLYYVITERGYPSERTRRYRLAVGALYDRGTLLAQDRSIRIVEEYTKIHWSSLGWPDRLILEDSSQGVISTDSDTLVDSGPFYHRMLTQFSGTFHGHEIQGLGVSEYLRPRRLAVAAFRPFVKFRARRAGR